MNWVGKEEAQTRQWLAVIVEGISFHKRSLLLCTGAIGKVVRGRLEAALERHPSSPERRNAIEEFLTEKQESAQEKVGPRSPHKGRCSRAPRKPDDFLS